ncbi:Gfo/Idh/MocA family protein [Sphingomonas sp.]|uniref:Gfo/Idh/MocA family protein n=1 Tax=Sphingomonas sp. TaxID=28214 RepID=UPI003CC6D0F6
MSRPRIGFLGTGWIGRHRMAAMVDTGTIEAVGFADPSDQMAADALALAPGAVKVEGLEGLLALGLDAVVIATPSALHAAQSVQALDEGVAVFCQKPLGRDTAEAQAVVAAARRADRLLGVDFSYRHTAGMQAIVPLVQDRALGAVFAVDLTFHNAYGPDKPWFYDRAQSGGGCVMDLGVHLVDLALWSLGFPSLDGPVAAELLAGGKPVTKGAVEDYAAAQFRLSNGANVRLACSWRLHAGQEAVIEAAFYGTEGGARLRNVGGSFYDFTAERLHGTTRETLTQGADAWGGRAAAGWARRLAMDGRFSEEADDIVRVAAVVDAIYGVHGAV